MGKILEIQNVCMYFRGVKAVDNISATVCDGEIFGIIGPNGSGKTTLINVITGIYTPSKGTIQFQGQNITGLKPHKIAEIGIARTFQNLRIFKAMTVRENIIVGEHTTIKTNTMQALFATKVYRESEQRLREKADEILDLVGLRNMANEISGGMAYGQQKRLEIARALVSEPKLCLLDEPAAGMNTKEAMEMMGFIQRIHREKKITIILIEHNMKAMMSTAEKIMVMDSGMKIAEALPAEVQKDPQVIKVYLGGDEDASNN